jgi:hypothetical protein
MLCKVSEFLMTPLRILMIAKYKFGVYKDYKNTDIISCTDLAHYLKTMVRQSYYHAVQKTYEKL